MGWDGRLGLRPFQRVRPRPIVGGEPLAPRTVKRSRRAVTSNIDRTRRTRVRLIFRRPARPPAPVGRTRLPFDAAHWCQLISHLRMAEDDVQCRIILRAVAVEPKAGSSSPCPE